MTTIYEYWQDRATGAVWAVKLKDRQVIGVVEIGSADAHQEILPYLSYRPSDTDQFKQSGAFRKIDGRKVA